MAKKILFASHTANFAKFNRPFMRDLREKGYEVDYASAGEEEVKDVDRHIKVDFARSPLALLNHWRAYWQMRRLLLDEDYALIHCHTPVGGVLTRLAELGAVRKKQKAERKQMDGLNMVMRKPAVIYTSHGFHFYKGGSLLNWLLFYPIEKWLAKSTDLILTINHEDYDLAKRKFRGAKIGQIPGVGVDLERFHPVGRAERQALRQKEGLLPDDFVLIYTAELNKNKNQKMIIQALPQLAMKIPTLKVLFVGTGAERKNLEKLVKKLGVEANVRFLGYRQDVPQLLQLADVAISASTREGLGLGLVEGMASGLPIVARDNRGHREVVESAKTGMLFQTPEGFVQAVEELYRNPDKRRDMGQYNIKQARKFALEKVREQMAEIYQEYLREW